MTDSESLIGSELQIPMAERAKLDEGATFISDLVGVKVFDRGREVGQIQDVRFGSGEAPTLVVQGEKEVLIPYAAAFIKSLDVAGKRLEMELPEGLLEL
jgi:16S rRNA processing protein RimM